MGAQGVEMVLVIRVPLGHCGLKHSFDRDHREKKW